MSGFLAKLGEAGAAKMLKAAGPEVAEAIGRLEAFVIVQNEHLSAIANNTGAIAERLGTIDNALMQIRAAQLAGEHTDREIFSVLIARFTMLDTALARIAHHLTPPAPPAHQEDSSHGENTGHANGHG